MIGSHLRSLSTLANLDPDLYRQHLSRYRDHPSRYELPNRMIPKLNCRWQDSQVPVITWDGPPEASREHAKVPRPHSLE